jgi:hypothetical protein
LQLSGRNQQVSGGNQQVSGGDQDPVMQPIMNRPQVCRFSSRERSADEIAQVARHQDGGDGVDGRLHVVNSRLNGGLNLTDS